MKRLLEILIMFGICFICYIIPYLIIIFIDIGSYWSLPMFLGGGIFVFILKWLDFKKFKKIVEGEFEKSISEQQEYYEGIISTFRNNLMKKLAGKPKKKGKKYDH
jgi:hypothetical protein